MSDQDQDSTRRSLKTLQRDASDEVNLVGRSSKGLKHQISQDTSIDVEIKRKKLSSKETQASFVNKITVDDLTNPEGPSENYWHILAERRRFELQEVLVKNEKLRKIVEDMKKENIMYKQMLDEANSFLEVIKEELVNASNDTGIDVNDVGTADTTTDTSTLEDATEDTSTPSKE